MENKHFLKKLIVALTAMMTIFLMSSTAAMAGNNDLKLTQLCGKGSCEHNEGAAAAFKNLSQEVSSLLAPMHFQPASTLGEEGFEIAFESKMSFSTQDDASWAALKKNSNAVNSDANVSANGVTKDSKFAAPDIFATMQLHMRKGLPFSLEVEGVFNWLANSEIFYVGAGVRWAPIEGFWYLPDLSVRAHVGTIVGASDLSLINVNMDIALSYTWGLGGIVAITPYGGYTLLTSWASSRPLVITKTDGSQEETVFRRVNNHLSRGFIGVQLKGDFFVFAVEGELGSKVSALGLKIGADF